MTRMGSVPREILLRYFWLKLNICTCVTACLSAASITFLGISGHNISHENHLGQEYLVPWERDRALAIDIGE